MYFFYIMERVSGFIVIEEESDQLITTYLTTMDKQSSCKKNNSKPKYKQIRPSIGRKETYCRGPQSLTIIHHERLLNLSCNWAQYQSQWVPRNNTCKRELVRQLSKNNFVPCYVD